MEIVNLQIQIFLLLAVGYILAKKNFLSKETRTQMTNIVLMVMLPCSIVMSFQIDLTDKVIQSTISVLFISICIQFFYGFLNKILYNRYSQDKKICLQYGTMVSNAGFMGMPIAQGVFGDIGLLYASVFLIPQGQNLGSRLLDYTKQQCLQKNITHISLNTIRGFLSDVFYQKNGFYEKTDIVCMGCQLEGE